MGAGDFVYSPGPGGGTTNPVNLPPTSSPATPSTGINFTSQLFANRAIPIWKDPAAQIWPVQEALWVGPLVHLQPTDGALVPRNAFGQSVVAEDTSVASTTNWASTNRYTRAIKTIFTSVAAINRGAGYRWNTSTPAYQFVRGNAAGVGGLFMFMKFGMETYAAGNRLFCGLQNATLTNFYTGDPSAATGDYIGLGMDAADSAVTLYTRDGTTTTKTTIPGMPAPASSGAFYVDFYVYIPPNGSAFFYRVDDATNGTTIVDTSISTTIPRTTIPMAPNVVMGSGTVAAGCAVAMTKVYTVGQFN